MTWVRCIFAGAARGIAAFFGAFTLLSLAGELRHKGLAANRWWIDLRPLAAWLAGLLLFAGALLLVAYAVRPAAAPWRRTVTAVAVGMLVLAALLNAAVYYRLLLSGKIASGLPVPFSALVCGALGIVLWGVLSGRATNGVRCMAVAGAAAGCCLLAFPLAQMVLFGKTDYRRPADAIVVFGARVYADGRPSDALSDRTRTGCRLYLEGLADRIIFSGGPGDGAVHETECMRRIALDMGVPEDAIALDPDGVNTAATVANTTSAVLGRGARRILAVSHFYHLPRIKLCFSRAGVEAYTVPAQESYVLSKLPHFMLREVAALWVYYLRAIVA
jgi:uncharacterized SAM-binding protein YcdF (DUF218 family)